MHILPEPGPRDANQAEAQGAVMKLYQSFQFSLSLDHALGYDCLKLLEIAISCRQLWNLLARISCPDVRKSVIDVLVLRSFHSSVFLLPWASGFSLQINAVNCTCKNSLPKFWKPTCRLGRFPDNGVPDSPMAAAATQPKIIIWNRPSAHLDIDKPGWIHLMKIRSLSC